MQNLKTIALTVTVLIMTACATNDGIPQVASSSKIEKTAEQSWTDITTKMGLSDDAAAKARFDDITRKVIAASDLSDENWDIKLFDKPSPNVFSLPGYRIGGHGIDKLSDDRIASMSAFGVASLELKHAEQMASRAKLGRFLVGASKPLFVGGETSEAKKQRQRNEALLKLQQPPTPVMRRAATARAEEIVNKAGFSPDFLISTSLLNLHGPLK